MGIKRERIGRLNGSIKQIFTGIFCGASVMIIGSLVTALLIDNKVLDFESAAYGIVVSLITASFVSALVSSKGGGSVWTVTLASAIGLLLVLLTGNLMMGIGRVEGVLQSSLVIIGGSLCAILLRLKPQKARSYIRNKY